jgi:hypothetical protein
MKFVSKCISIFLIACILFPITAIAKEKEEKIYVRTEEAHPFWIIGKSTMWGGLTGLMLGGAIHILGDNKESVAGKGFAAGVIIGFAVGLYAETNRKKEDEEVKNYNINIVPIISTQEINDKKVLVYKWDLLQYNF